MEIDIKEVTKAEFKEAYVRFGKLEGGYDLAYWDHCIDGPKYADFKYFLEEPASANENCMMLATDFQKDNRRFRMFFFTIEQEERFFDYPGKDAL